MTRHFLRLVVFMLLSLFLRSPASAQGIWSSAVILSPSGGQAVQGIVQIIGSAEGSDFSSYELSYQLHDDPTETWFLIQSGIQAVSEGILGEWSTSNLTDGNYSLQLEVFFQNGSMISDSVDLVRVRNYSPIETQTPPALPTENTFQHSTDTPLTAQADLPPTPTDFPPNPARLDSQDLSNSIQFALIASLVGLTLLWLYAKRNR